MTELEEENKQLRLVAKNTATEITDLKATLVYAYSSLEKKNQELNSLKEEVIQLKRLNIKLEAYTRRENMKIFGIKDDQGESNSRTEELVRIMMQEKMNIPEKMLKAFVLSRCIEFQHSRRWLALPRRDRLLQNSVFTRIGNICVPLLRTSEAVDLELLTNLRKKSMESSRGSIQF